MRLTGSQIAAGIALAGLSGESVASETGIARSTIYKITAGTAAYRDDTINKIREVLETRGIEFTPGEGVRKKEQTVTTYNGDDCLQQLFVNVYDTLKDKGGELLIAHLNEEEAAKSLQKEFISDQIQKRKAANITCRMLVRANDPGLWPPYDTYRAIPDELFSPYPFCVYGPKLALVSWQPAPRVIIIDDERFAVSARKLFEIAWMNGKQITRDDKK